MHGIVIVTLMHAFVSISDFNFWKQMPTDDDGKRRTSPCRRQMRRTLPLDHISPEIQKSKIFGLHTYRYIYSSPFFFSSKSCHHRLHRYLTKYCPCKAT